MNQLGRDVLREAALKGVRQITGDFKDKEGGMCGLGVLLDGVSDPSRLKWYGLGHKRYGLGHTPVSCPICSLIRPSESNLMIHLNDYHRLDFLGLAEKMPVSPEAL